MPKMTHWNSSEVIDAPAEKLAVYQAQGWVRADRTAEKVQPDVTAVTTDAVTETPAPKPVKKAAAKKSAAKKAAAKKS